MHLIALLCACVFFSTSAGAADAKEMDSITVLADARLAATLSELASLYSHRNMISVSATFGESEAQKKKIEDGESADIYITPDMLLVQELKVKGMVDFNSIGRLASFKDAHFVAAVIAGENMSAGRKFLKFLKTDEAHNVFKKNGFSIP